MSLIQRTSYDWRYETVPQANACLGLKNSTSFWPMGKVFGGSHRMSNMIYHRGQKSDYEVLDDNGTLMNVEEDLINVEKTRFTSKLSDAFVDAGHELGLFGNFLFYYWFN